MNDSVIQACMHGDRNGQKVVYETYYKKMYAVCRSYGSNEDEARDLLHDGFIKVFHKLEKKPDLQNFDGWIRKVFVNNCLDFVRSAYKKYIVYQDNETTLQEYSDLDNENDSAYLDQFNTQQILKGLQMLRPDYRVILNLYAVENMNHTEIAAHLNIKEASSRSKLMRARNSLKKILTEGKKQ